MSPDPQAVGAFTIQRILGRGSLGTVFLAEQRDPIVRDVAVKVLSKLDAASQAHFHAERTILSTLQHPNIVGLIDPGVAESETPYFVMQYVEGSTLGEFMATNEPSLAQRAQLFGQLSDAVSYLHARGVAHRDLIPENILVTARSGDAAIKLLDFSTAQHWEEPLPAAEVRTDVAALADLAAQHFYARVENSARKSSVPASLTAAVERLAVSCHGSDATIGDVAPLRDAVHAATSACRRGQRRRRGAVWLGAATLAVLVGFFVFGSNSIQELRLRLETGRQEATYLWPIEGAQVESLRAWFDEYAPVEELCRQALSEGGAASELALLRERMATFFGTDRGTCTGSVSWRAREATRVRQVADSPRTADAWDAAITAVATSPLYGGLRLERDPRLVPLRQDPRSGLYEFWLLGSGQRPEPSATATSGWEVTPETGIVLVLLPGGECVNGSELYVGSRVLADPGGLRVVTNARGVGAGLLFAGDRITECDQAVVRTASQLEQLLLGKPAGSHARLRIQRDDAAIDVDVPVSGGNLANFWFEETIPSFAVTLAPFYMGKFEVTQGQWSYLMVDNPSFATPQSNLTHPVENVSRWMALEYLRRAAVQLPTEAQWEYAARGGTRGMGWWGPGPAGSEMEHLGATAGAAAGAQRRHRPVGSCRSNPFGLHDMVGNLQELCRDGWGLYGGPVAAGDGYRQGSERVFSLRGGDYRAEPTKPWTAARSGWTLQQRNGRTGFRVSMPLRKPRKAG